MLALLPVFCLGHHTRMAAIPREITGVTQDINVLEIAPESTVEWVRDGTPKLVKGKERYVFLFDDGHRGDALRTLGRFASNPELSFTWYDAAVLSQRIRQAAEESNKQDAVLPPDSPLAGPHTLNRPRFKLPMAGDAASADESGDGVV